VAIRPGADRFGDRRRVVLGQREFRRDGLGALDEKRGQFSNSAEQPIEL